MDGVNYMHRLSNVIDMLSIRECVCAAQTKRFLDGDLLV